MPSSDEDCNIQECVEASGDGSEDTSEAPDAEGGGRVWFFFFILFVFNFHNYFINVPDDHLNSISIVFDLVNNSALSRLFSKLSFGSEMKYCREKNVPKEAY